MHISCKRHRPPSYHSISLELEVVKVLGTDVNLGTPKTKQQKTDIIQQNPINYTTFQTQQETKHRPPQRGSKAVTLAKQWSQHFEKEGGGDTQHKGAT